MEQHHLLYLVVEEWSKEMESTSGRTRSFEESGYLDEMTFSAKESHFCKESSKLINLENWKTGKESWGSDF